MIESLVDKVIVITVPGAQERQGEITRQLAQLNIPFDFQYAIPLKEEELITKPFLGWTNGAKSLKLTTIKILEEFKQKGWKRILVLEDDCFFDFENYDQICTNVKDFVDKVEGNFHFLHTFYSFVPGLNFTTHNGILKLNKGALGCQSYIINYTIVDEYLHRLKSSNKPIDHVTRDIHIEKKMSYGTMQMLTRHVVGRYSYIRDKKVSY